MLLQSLRALCLAPGRSGSVCKYFKALVRLPVVTWRIARGCCTKLHVADAIESEGLRRGFRCANSSGVMLPVGGTKQLLMCD